MPIYLNKTLLELGGKSTFTPKSNVICILITFLSSTHHSSQNYAEYFYQCGKKNISLTLVLQYSFDFWGLHRQHRHRQPAPATGTGNFFLFIYFFLFFLVGYQFFFGHAGKVRLIFFCHIGKDTQHNFVRNDV